MYGALLEETVVKVSASKAWELYGTLKLAKVAIGKTIEAVDIVEGDGGIGTILKVTIKLGSDLKYYKEKFTKIDNENKVREAEIVEGAFLNLGFTLYRIKIEIKENPYDDTGTSCIIKLTVEYEVKEEAAGNASLATNEPLLAIMSIANEHLLKSN